MAEINPLKTYWFVTRGAVSAIVRSISGLDLLMFPSPSAVFEDQATAEQFAAHFNQAQTECGVLSLKNSTFALRGAA